MKKAMLIGYYGKKNTGDDALLAVTVWGSRKYLNAESIYVNASCLPQFDGSEQLKTVSSPNQLFRGENKLRQYLAALKTNGIIFGGGSIFHSSDGIKNNIKLLKLSGNNNHSALGIGIGPFRDTKAEKYCIDLLNRLTFVGLRDQQSYDIVRSIAPNVRTEKTFDLAILLPVVYGLTPDSLCNINKKKGIGFALCNYERFIGEDTKNEELRFNKIIKLMKHIDAREVEEVVLIDFNGHNVFGDKNLNDKIESYIGDRFYVKRINYQSNPIEVIKVIADLKVLVAMRLHAVIFGYLTRTSTIMLSYHPKCIEFANDIRMHPEYVFDSVGFDIQKVANYIKQAIFEELEKPKLSLQEAEYMAMKNWTWFQQ